jgi:membrane-anchored protein YejM (alkaline phosphatase superfamily)
MARNNDPIFNEVISNYERQRVKELMGFRQYLNKEIIAQFYATMHFGHIGDERTMTWMTNALRYSITFHRFLRCFGIMVGDKVLRKLHDEGELDKDALHLMYPIGDHAYYGKVKNLYTYYAALDGLFRVSITPRDGNPSKITKFQKKLLVALRLGAQEFSAWGFRLARNQASNRRPQKYL